ncbi:TIGR03773 family transporter-associated surface protein [Yinghuangia sp. ASG 101]|uniref:TIGR03773 family transporter-associated surface protein n=1 Tax=Yinghuangia sp. ASG 101 TaxID=2896848 RepID=UPI001E6277DF|nr:TIGR03773 family transporter-associated surface protein [Yinghuangia sp. ASG 101]UGQ11045.1 TIGR03773 family transporter-associated surface protein [Yinghuangia sp. ASG 101]
MTARRRRGGTLATAVLACLATALAPAAAVPQPPPPTGNGTVIADGHLDLGPRVVDGRWTVQIRDDTTRPPTWRYPEDVVVHVTDTARQELPDDPAYTFLGAPGEPVWLLPQVQQAGVPWPGWNTQDPSVLDPPVRDVAWSIERVQGPGTFVLFLNEDFGAPHTVFNSTRPFPQQLAVEPNTHAHGNWAFTRPGVYLLDVRMTARASDGRALDDRRTLRLAVGTPQPRDAFAVAWAVPAPADPPVAPPESDGGPPVAEPPGEKDDSDPPVAVIAVCAIGGAALVTTVALVLRRRRQPASQERPS